MRDDGAATTGQGGGTKASRVADPATTDREDSAEDAVQSPVCCRPIDCGIAEADRSQLCPRDDTMLAIGHNRELLPGSGGSFPRYAVISPTARSFAPFGNLLASR
jgi:hypothetical protein